MYPGTFAETTPDKPAVIMGGSGESVSYAELNERSLRLANYWRSIGLTTGDHVAVLAENHLRYYEIYWAAMRSGLYLTAVNRYLAPDEAAYIVNDSGSTSLIITHGKADAAAGLADLIPACTNRLMMDGTIDGWGSYEDALASSTADPLPSQPKGEVMLYSSGTTGRPKGVLRPLSGLHLGEEGSLGISQLQAFVMGMSADSVYLSPAPMYHAAPLIWSCGVHELGGTVVAMEKFDAVEYLRLVQEYSGTHSQLVPTMFVRMLKLPEDVRQSYDVSSLEAVVHAAAPCPVEVKRQMIEWWGPIVNEYYAGTEGNGLTWVNAQDWLAHPGSVGKPLIGIAHICDDEGNELPTGESGIVYFEQEGAVFEYHGDEEKTKESRHPKHPNWSALGDIGYLDEDGFLYLTDRKAFMIISGGVNIYPQEVEDCLVMHDKVADVAVFGLPDDEMGEFVQAVVQVAEGVEPTDELAAELHDYCREHIAHYKVPRVIDFRPELPRLPTGKLYKRLLRDEYMG